MTEFLRAFFPNFAATLIGVTVGSLAAWAIETWFERRRHRDELGSREVAVRHALEVVRLSIRHNEDGLARVIAALKQGSTIVNMPIETTTWDALQNELINLPNPRLKHNIVRYFSSARQLIVLQEIHLNYGVGLAAALSQASDVYKTAADAFLDRALSLQNMGREIDERLGSYLSAEQKPQS